MLVQPGDQIPVLHGRFGITVYAVLVISVNIGRLYMKQTPVIGWRISRNQHRYFAIFALSLMFLMLMHGLFTFIIQL